MKLEEVSPFTTLIPQSPIEQIVVYNDQAALRIAIDKEATTLLDADWEKPGANLIFYPIGPDGLFEIYVGQASTGGLRSRMLSLKNVRPWWLRAQLITSVRTNGYNSFLEGAEEASLRSTGWPPTAAEQRRGPERYPGDWFTPARPGPMGCPPPRTPHGPRSLASGSR